MTLKHLRLVLALVIAVYAAALMAGIALWRAQAAPGPQLYQLYKDLVPLIIAIPAAYLAFAFQRRNSYLQALRAVWSQSVGAISTTLAYTDNPAPTQADYLAVLTKLSSAIEEVRGVYKNVPVKGAPEGWYPFEPIKQIYQLVKDLGYDSPPTAAARQEARTRIYGMWKPCRNRLLSEFDRDKPTYHHAEHASAGPTHGAAAPFGAG